jgi:hypothetical protein
VLATAFDSPDLVEKNETFTPRNLVPTEIFAYFISKKVYLPLWKYFCHKRQLAIMATSPKHLGFVVRRPVRCVRTHNVNDSGVKPFFVEDCLLLLCEERRTAVCTESREESPDHIMNRPFRNAKVGDFVDLNCISELEKDSFNRGIYLGFNFM